MKITDYLKAFGNDAAVSRLAGIDRSAISRIRRGLADPPLSTVLRIIDVTGGSINIEHAPTGGGPLPRKHIMREHK